MRASGQVSQVAWSLMAVRTASSFKESRNPRESDFTARSVSGYSSWMYVAEGRQWCRSEVFLERRGQSGQPQEIGERAEKTGFDLSREVFHGPML